VYIARFGVLMLLALLVSYESITMLFPEVNRPMPYKPIPYTWNKEIVDRTAGADYLTYSRIVIDRLTARRNVGCIDRAIDQH
jgi:hypothetical protein